MGCLSKALLGKSCPTAVLAKAIQESGLCRVDVVGVTQDSKAKT